MVEVDGEYIRILDRASELINVGGLKVYPVQVENVIEQMDNVEDVIVNSDVSPITGQIVKATVKLTHQENLTDFRKRMVSFCKDKLEAYAVPQKVVLIDKLTYGERFKKMRKAK
jgi:acyl-CoA synthetase (AMP-forming)/AMP-acid ligase II